MKSLAFSIFLYRGIAVVEIVNLNLISVLE